MKKLSIILLFVAFATILQAQNKSTVPTGAAIGKFSISENKQVYFSKGNLQYQASTNTWRFAEHQWDYVGGTEGEKEYGTVYEKGVKSNTAMISSSYTGWIDLFGYGTSGYNHGAVSYQPWSTNFKPGEYLPYGCDTCNLYDQTGKADWGYNAISNGGNKKGFWRCLTREESDYILKERNTVTGIRFVMAKVNGVNGMILLPDDWNSNVYIWELPFLSVLQTEDLSQNSPKQRRTNDDSYDNAVTASQWDELEKLGAVFLPSAGSRVETRPESMQSWGFYWTSSCNDFFWFDIDGLCSGGLWDPFCNGFSVRLVCPVEN